MKKKLLSFVSVMLAFLVQFSILTIIPAKAADNPFENSPFINAITITDETTGKVLGNSDSKSGKTDTVKVKFDFTIPDDDEIPDGTTYNFTIPNQITMPDSGFSSHLTMTDSNNDEYTIADVSIDKNGNGVITFNDSANKFSGINGFFYVESKFAGEKISNLTPVPLYFTIEGTADPTTINVYFTQPETEIKKSNGVFDNVTDTVSWTVSLNSNKTTVTDGVFTDTLPDGLTYKDGTFTVKDSSGTVVFKDGSVSTLGTFDSSNNPLKYSFGKDVEDSYTITYDTAVAEDYFGKTLTNTSTLKQPNSTVTSTATVTPKKTYITKTASSLSVGDTKIDWTITFNQPGGTLNNFSLSDSLPSGLTLDSSSYVILDKGTANEISLGTDTEADIYYTYSSNKLVVKSETLSGQHTLSFSTNLPNGYWEKTESSMKNTAYIYADNNTQLKSGASGSYTVPGSNFNVITKSGGGYDAPSHTITWNMTVNEKSYNVLSPTITDDISAASGNAQTYVPNSFTVTDKNGNVVFKDGSVSTLGTFTYTPVSGSDTKTGTLEYSFGKDISDKYTISYKTTVNDTSVYANNTDTKYKNSVSLKTSSGFTSTSSATQAIKVTDLEKSASYDYVKRELKWTVKIDKSGVPLTSVKLSDVLGGEGTGLDDFTFDETSLSLSGTPLEKGTSADTLSDNQYYYDTTTKTLTVFIGNVSSEKDLTYIMKVSEPNVYFSKNGSKDVKNTVVMTDDQYSPVSISGSLKIQNNLVNKTSDYTNNNDYIDWIVHINQNAIKLEDLDLKDTLKEGLSLDTSSVRLYKQTLLANGTLSPDSTKAAEIDSKAASAGVSAIELGSENISYNSKTRNFEFTIPSDCGSGTQTDPYGITNPYVLVFRTYVDEAHHSDSFTNTISFSGSAETEVSTSSNTNVFYAIGGGASSGQTATLAVKKIDSESSVPLKNAEFGIYDKYGNLVESSISDENGNVSLPFLQFGVPYTLRELTAPTNYQLSSEAHTFILKKGTSKGIYEFNAVENGYTDFVSSTFNYTITDTLKTGTIKVMKTDTDNNPLSGATFTLLTAQEQTL